MLTQRVAYIRPEGSTEVPPGVVAGGPLGASLFIRPRVFDYNVYEGPGQFTLTEQGLIAFMANDPSPPWGKPYSDGGYRIVTRPDGTMDAAHFMCAMAEICIYGTHDEAASHTENLTTARLRKLEMRCGRTIAFVQACAAMVSLETRRVHLISDGTLNGFDDGHVAVEVKVNNRWQLFDVAMDRAFANGVGDILSLADVISAGVANCRQIPLAEARAGRSAPGALWSSQFFDMMLGCESDRMDWLNRIYRVPGHGVPGGVVWGIPSSSPAGTGAMITGYPGTSGWTAQPFEEWRARFYA